MTDITVTRSKAQEMRDVADTIDGIHDLPDLYITFSACGGFGIQVPQYLSLTDAERMAVADRLAAAFGVECGVKFVDEKSGAWTYGTDYGVAPEIYAPQIRTEKPPS